MIFTLIRYDPSTNDAVMGKSNPPSQGGGNESWIFGFSASQLGAEFYPSTGQIRSGVYFANSIGYRVEVTYDGNFVTLQVEGGQRQTQQKQIRRTGSPLWVCGSGFLGSINDLRIWENW